MGVGCRREWRRGKAGGKGIQQQQVQAAAAVFVCGGGV